MWWYSNGTHESTGLVPVNTPLPDDLTLDNEKLLTATLPYMSAQDLSGLNLAFNDTDPNNNYISIRSG